MGFPLNTGSFVGGGDGSFEWDRVRRILFFIWGGNGVATGIFRMDEMQFYTPVLAIPTLGAVSAPGLDGRYDLDWDDITDDDDNGAYDGSYTVSWSEPPGANVYQLEESRTADFAAYSETWTTEAFAAMSHTESADTWYYRVKSWTALPEDSGVGSIWSSTKSINLDPTVPVMDRII